MPPRSTPPPPPPRGAFYPPNDAATHRDLLLFEERLKTMADSLQRRKLRYELFLAQLVVVTLVLLAEVRLHTSFLAITYRYILHTLLPDAYPPDTDPAPHPYIATGLLLVSVTTLVLFFASGMYSQKIAYANRYVPHANKSLRSLNMYLNVRQPPLRSKFPFNLFPFFFPRTTTTHTVTHRSSPQPQPTSPTPHPVPIPPIPPSTNPRGELIFSSRVDRAFRDAYARHRTAFERRRDELERIARARSWHGRLLLALQPWKHRSLATSAPSSSSSHYLPSSSSSATPVPSGAGTPGRLSRTVSVSISPSSSSSSSSSSSPSSSSRGRAAGSKSKSTTPAGSRRPSPVPQKDHSPPAGMTLMTTARRRVSNLDVP